MQLHSPSRNIFVHGPLPDDQLSQTFSRARVLLAPLRYGAGVKGKLLDAWRHRTPVVTTPIGAEGIIDTPSYIYAVNQHIDRSIKMLGTDRSTILTENYLTQWRRLVNSSFDTLSQFANDAQANNELHLMSNQSNSTRICQSDWIPSSNFGGYWKSITEEDIAHDAVRLYTNQELWEKTSHNGECIVSNQYNRERNADALDTFLHHLLVTLDTRRSKDLSRALLLRNEAKASHYLAKYIEYKEREN